MPKPDIQFISPEKYWDDAKEGDECTSPTYVVTAERIDAYADSLVTSPPCMWTRHTPKPTTLASAWRTA